MHSTQGVARPKYRGLLDPRDLSRRVPRATCGMGWKAIGPETSGPEAIGLLRTSQWTTWPLRTLLGSLCPLRLCHLQCSTSRKGTVLEEWS